jgi:hypothetical protein
LTYRTGRPASRFPSICIQILEIQTVKKRMVMMAQRKRMAIHSLNFLMKPR